MVAVSCIAWLDALGCIPLIGAVCRLPMLAMAIARVAPEWLRDVSDAAHLEARIRDHHRKSSCASRLGPDRVDRAVVTDHGPTSDGDPSRAGRRGGNLTCDNHSDRSKDAGHVPVSAQ